MDITTVVVQKLHFQRREKKYSNVLLTLIILEFIGTFLYMVYLLIMDNGQVYKARLIIMNTWLAFSFLFLVVTQVLFIYAAYTKHQAAFLDYRLNLFL
jgi:hypothetical protein